MATAMANSKLLPAAVNDDRGYHFRARIEIARSVKLDIFSIDIDNHIVLLRKARMMRRPAGVALRHADGMRRLVHSLPKLNQAVAQPRHNIHLNRRCAYRH